MGLTTDQVPIVNAVMDEFGWERCAVIATTDAQHSNLATETKTFLEDAGKIVYYHVTNTVAVPSSNRVSFKSGMRIAYSGHKYDTVVFTIISGMPLIMSCFISSTIFLQM